MELLSARRPEMTRHLLLGCGVLMEGFYPRPGLTAQAAAAAFVQNVESGIGVLGCTRGGCFEVSRSFGQIRLAGQRGPCVLTTAPVWTEVALSGQLLEVSQANLARLLSMSLSWTGDGGTAMELSLAAPPACADSLCWLGERADGGRLLICLRRAVNTGSPRLEPDENGHAAVSFRFVAQDAIEGPESGGEQAPFTVWHLEDPAETEEST